MQLPMSNSLTAHSLNSNESKKSSDGKKSHKNSKSVSIKIRTVSGADSLILIESVKTNSSKSYSYSRVTTRRFASAHTVGIWNLQSSDLSGVNSPAVISAWGLSRPRVDFFATNGDIHGVFNVDLLNLIPTDGSFAKRVSYCDAFIKDGHLGADKAEMKEIADQQAPTKSCVKTFDTLKKETLRGDSSTEKIDARREEITTSSSVDLRISHANSLSRKVVR